MEHVLITGASEGIGRCLAQILGQRYALTLVARDELRLKSLVESLPGGASRHKVWVLDLSQQNSVEALISKASAHEWKGWINNAGFGLIGKFHEQSVEKIRQMLMLNIQCVVEGSHFFLNQAHKGAFLVNISSTLSFLPLPVQAVYSATKAFVTSFTESLWAQQKSRGIRVLCFCPGVTWTHFNDRAGGDPGDFPRWMGEKPEVVANGIVQALEKNSGPTVVSGFHNRVFVFLSRLVSRRVLSEIMQRIQQ